MKNIIIVDIDGTLSKVGDRIKYLQQSPKDWDSFYSACFEDEPIQEITDLVRFLGGFHRVVFCTGRRESVRKETLKWLHCHLPGIVDEEESDLLMRPNKDHRHDTLVKPEQVEKAGIDLNDIAFVLEDRNSMVAKWRELGLKCLQVADGDF